MPANPPKDMPRITAGVYYDDPVAAIDWLVDAFGFEVRVSIPGPGGGIAHAELTLEDGVVMIGPTSAREECKSPRSLGGAVTQGLYVYVDDVDAHCNHARSRGAKIVQPPEDQFYGDRNYRVEDLEGHRWAFATHVRDVALEDMPSQT